MMVVGIQAGAAFRYDPPARLFEGAYMRGGQPPTYDVSPDGRFVMLKTTAAEEPGNQPLGVVVNWTDDLERQLATRP